MEYSEMRKKMEKELQVDFTTTFELSIKEVYNAIFLPLTDKIKEEHKKTLQLQSEVKQLRTDISQINNEFKQLQTNYNTLEGSNTQTLTDLNRLTGSHTSMPKHVSLIQKHIDESIDGLTVTDIARQIKKSRSSVYLTVKWLVLNNYIVKQGTRYLNPYNQYVIKT